jgi:hypothetical protein
MALTSGDIITLLALRKPKVCAYWAVYWDFGNDAETRYYSDALYQQMSGFLAIDRDLEAQVLGGSIARNVQYEINPDIKSEKVNIRFNDIPARGSTTRPLSPKFQQWKSGVRCELFFYYADVNKHVSKWTGQLKAPKEYGHDTIEAVATNGFRSREQKLPKRTRPRECTFIFGGQLPNQEAIDSNGCAYNKHLPGGTVGAFRTGSTPYLSCPKTEAACNARFATSNAENHGGFNTDASATVTSGNPNVGPAVSKGNQSSLTKPIRKIYGTKFVREMPLLLWRRETGAPNPDHDWVSGISEVGEGPISQVYDLRVVGGRPPQQIATQIRLGTRAQAAVSNYAATVENFSYTAHVRWKYGWINAGQTGASDMTCEGRVIGFAAVPVYTDDDPLTFTRIWSDNRVWCLFDAMTDHRSGLGYAHSRFDITTWKTVADWTLNTSSFVATDLDGGSVTYAGRRSTFDATLEGRPSHEQIEDICRSGGFSLPFLHDDGQMHLREFRKATSDELTNARVFSDNTQNGNPINIIWDGKRPAITFGQTPDDELINQIDLTFEEADNYDVARTLTVDDPNQKLLAGRALLGEDNLHPVPKAFSAFGCGHVHEVVRLAYRLLWFGEFDKGGTQNNVFGKLTVPAIWVEGLKRYEIIKLDTELDDRFTIGTDDGVNDLTVTSADTYHGYYRFMSGKKTGNGLVEMTVQAYNHTAYTYFDVVTSGSPPIFNACSIDADCPTGYVCRNGICVPEPPPPPCLLAFDGPPVYDDTTGLLDITILPC